MWGWGGERELDTWDGRLDLCDMVVTLRKRGDGLPSNAVDF